MNRRSANREVGFEEVRALLAGELDEARAAAVRSELTDDPELVRAAMDLGDPERLAELAGLSGEEVERAWSRFESQLNASDSQSTTAGANERRPVRLKRLAADHIVWLLAASLLLGIGLGSSLNRASSSHEGEAKQVVLERLERLEATSSTRGAGAPLEVDERLDLIVLLLPPPPGLEVEVPHSARYTVTRGADMVAFGEIEQQDEGYFALALSPVPSGDYVVELFRVSEVKSFARYRFTVSRENRR